MGIQRVGAGGGCDGGDGLAVAAAVLETGTRGDEIYGLSSWRAAYAVEGAGEYGNVSPGLAWTWWGAWADMCWLVGLSVELLLLGVIQRRDRRRNKGMLGQYVRGS